MPLRIMGYDGAAYRNKLPLKEGQNAYPVITVVLYFGWEKHWKSLIA
jgi:hypothetical protein